LAEKTGRQGADKEIQPRIARIARMGNAPVFIREIREIRGSVLFLHFFLVLLEIG
jgi:hypothetical protein